MVASNITRFFEASPDLEEDAINAVYGSGYNAIVRMSEEQPRWLQRNMDVLVQLLQFGAFQPGLLLSLLYIFNVVVDGFPTFADEPEEVAVIKMVLIQHLELDSKTPWIDEDKTIRERPEALVVLFLAQDTRKPLRTQLQGQRRGAAEQEDALIDTLIKAVPKSSAVDAVKIIEDILVFLPSFNDGRPTWRENGLVLLLLARATSALREDLAPGRNVANLEQSRGYLELSDLLYRAKGAMDPA
ncbi:hypothetical protein EDB85DRAFT_2149870 [Lactarius pseudohatsudake]|nr:hypothetical protein EDB85DRAFT_2149870 [Lactarius pseudohatsudake]